MRFFNSPFKIFRTASPLVSGTFFSHLSISEFGLLSFEAGSILLWARQLSRYTDWLRVRRSGDRIPVGGRDFPHLSRPALGPTHPPVQWIPGLSRGKERPGREADPSPPSSALVMKGQSYTSTSPMGLTACTEPQRLYKGDLYLYLLIPSSWSQISTNLTEH